MVTRKIPMGEEVQALDYHARTMSYVIGTSRNADFKLREDDLFGAEGTNKTDHAIHLRIINNPVVRYDIPTSA